VTKNAMALVTKEDWEEFCRHTEIAENLYWEGGGVIREVIHRTIINLNRTSNSDNDCENSATDFQSVCKNSEIDSEHSNTRPDEDSDMEHAQPLYTSSK
jgi:hypothetical protein